jgi:shikimate kinase
MPGCGKSTLGRRLAKIRGMTFVDTDEILEQVENMSLQDVVNRKGVYYLRSLEGRVLSQLSFENHVIATGGSAVYSPSAMSHLGRMSARVYLQISMRTLTSRVDRNTSRGLAKMKSHSLQRLYQERVSLYETAADIVAPNDLPMSALSIEALNNQLNIFFDAQ